MNYKIEVYGMMRNALMFFVIVIAVLGDKWELAKLIMLYNIGISLTDISVNLKGENKWI